MLLEVELARSEVKLESKDAPYPIRHDQIPAATNGVGNQLNNVGADEDAGVTKREEHVDGGSNSAEQKTYNPGTDGICRDINVVVSDYRSNLARERGVSIPEQ